LDNAGYGVVRHLGQDGFVAALVDVDSGDWARPGVGNITASVLPAASAGGIVLMHDAGGDRSQTVAALDRIIPEMVRRGVTFTTVSRAVGLPAADVPAGTVELALGTVMLAAVGTARIAIAALEICLAVGGTLVLMRLLLTSWVAIVHGRRSRARERRRWPRPVSVVVPAFNESGTIAATVRSLVASDHPVEVVVVDDGSADGTADIVERLRLPNVRVVRKPNGGKPSALNAGIAASRHDVVVMLDGDTVFEPATVGNLVAPFADPQVGAVAGNARVADRRSLIARWQNIEYVVGFNIDRRVQDRWHAVTTVPGVVGAFRRAALLQVGGVSEQTLAEDTDLTIAVGRAGWRVVYEPTARAWTDAPATFAQLWRQRYRWSYGVIQSFWKHRRAVTAPMIDIYLVYGLIFLDPARTSLLWAVALFAQCASGAIAFRLEGEALRDLLLLPLQQLVYRQLMYAVLIQSILSAVAGTRMRWRKAPRAGSFSAAPHQEPAELLAVQPVQRDAA
jgi:cellulose synthase/poly-beta-1,6-N-acetylglucosamine synthase-like glycosyltransferase